MQAVERAKGDEAEWLRCVLYIDSLCTTAMRDYLLQVGKMRRPGSADDIGNVDRLLTEWEGVSAHEVATWEMCSVRWVRESRLRHERDPETGEPRPHDERLARILALKASGASQRAIAKEVGISQARVQQMLAAA